MFIGSYTHWGFNKPNNFAGNQYCVELDAGIDYKFDDDRCGQTAASYICEIRNFTMLLIDSHVTGVARVCRCPHLPSVL